MKKKSCFLKLLLLPVLLLAVTDLHAQIVSLGVRTGAASANVLLSTSAGTGNPYGKTISLYSASEIYAAGGMAGTISRLWWSKEGTGEYTTGDARITVWMKHVSDTAWLAVPDWSTELPGAQQVFADSAYSIPLGTGWVEVPFQSTFQWNGVDNIAVFVDWVKQSAPSAAINWARSTNKDANATRVGTTPALALLVNDNRPLVQFDIKGVISGNNIGVKRIVSPFYCTGSNPVSVEVQNFGKNVVSNFQVNWSVNGVPQPAGNFNITLDTFGAPNSSAVVTLGNYSFTRAAADLVAYTLLPNGLADTVNFNDTVRATVSASLAGAFTVNAGAPASATNFQSFASLSDTLSRYGICGPVTVNVAPGSGPYNETVFFGRIAGTGPGRSVRINGNGNLVQFNTVTGQRHMLTLSGTSYMAIDSLNFKALGTTYGYGALITEGAEYDSLTNCVFDLSAVTSTSSTNTSGIAFSNSLTSATSAGTNGSYCYIAGNHILGAAGTGGQYYSLSIAGTSNYNIIRNNVIENFYYYGIYISGATGSLIEGNELHRMNKTASLSTTYAIYTTGATPGTRILGNRVHDPVGAGASSTSAFSAFRLLGSGTVSEPVIVANNLAYNINQGGAAYGFYFSAAEHNKVYHNTVVFDNVFGGTGDNAGIYATGNNDGTEFKNNIVSITAGSGGAKYGFYYNAANSVADAQRNNIYVNSTQPGAQNYGYYTADYATQTDFQLAYPALEAGSLTVDPMFVNAAAGNLEPGNSMLQGAGLNLMAVVPEDINGSARSAAPAPGAYEMPFVAGANAGVAARISPSGLFCAGQHPVSVTVVNSGSVVITAMDIHWTLNGVPQTPVSYAGTLDTPGSAGGNIGTVVLGTVNILPGVNDIQAWTVLANDVNPSNDSLSFTIQPSLSGNYTVDAATATGGTNFASFADLTSVLSLSGVCGPVVVDVAAGSGPYNEVLSMGNIPGVSAVNTVRINGNGNLVQFGTSTTAGERQLLTLSGAQYVRIDSLNFKTLGTVGWGALITGGSAYDSITNCHFDLSQLTATTSANGTGIAFSGSVSTVTTTGNNGSHCYIAGNHILGPTTAGGPYYGISLVGGGNDSNILADNIIENFYYYGIYMSAVTGTLVKGNDIHRTDKTATTVGYGIYTTGAVPGTRIDGNRIHNPIHDTASSTSAFNGLRLTGDGTAADPVLAVNNAIYNINQGGASYGVYMSAANYNKVYHNTVAFNKAYGGTGVNYGIYATGTNTAMDVMNNIVSITAGSEGIKYGFYYNAATSLNDAQRNNIYVNSIQPGVQNYGYLTKAYVSRGDFLTDYPNLESGSLTVDPQFTNIAAGDLLPANMALQGNGLNLTADVPVDIIGIPRSTVSTPGAYEIPMPTGYNPGVASLVTPGLLFCQGMQEVRVAVVNAGTSQISAMEVHWSLNGVPQSPYQYTGLLDTPGSAAGNMDTVLLGTVNIPYGTNDLTAWTVITNDVNHANDTLAVTLEPARFAIASVRDTVCLGGDALLRLDPVSGYDKGMIGWERSGNGSVFAPVPNTDTAVLSIAQSAATWYRAKINSGLNGCYTDTALVSVVDPQIVSVTPGERCGTGTVALSATASSGSVVNWYDNPSGGTPVASGNSFTTPVLTATATYYVAAVYGNGGGKSIGPLNPASVGGGGYTSLNTYKTYFTVHRATMIESVDIFANATSVGLSSTIEIIDSATSNVIAAIPYTVTTGGSLTQGQTVLIGQSLPPGKYAMRMGNSTVSLYRNTAGSAFPYSSSDLSLTGQSFSGYPQYYYYFYNWKIGFGCTGPLQPVSAALAPPPAITVSASPAVACAGDTVTLTASSANPGYTYNWTPGNNTGSSVSVAPVMSSTYYVSAADNSGGQYQGCVSSDSVFVSVNPLPLASVTANGPRKFCAGDSVSLIASSGVGYIYQWYMSGISSPLAGAGNSTYVVDSSGKYFVKVTDLNHCSAVSQPVDVIVHPLPEPVIYVNGEILSTGNYDNYLWRLNGTPIPGATKQSYTATRSGDYSVTVTDKNGCSGTSEVWKVALAVENMLPDPESIKIYPNPASDVINVESPVDVSITIGALDGKLLLHAENAKSVNIGNLADGMYIIRINDLDGRLIQVGKFMKTGR